MSRESHQGPTVYFWTGDDPKDYVRNRRDIPEDDRSALISILKSGTVESSYRGFALCRICKAMLGSSDLVGYGFMWPQGADHYVEKHDVWHPRANDLLAAARAVFDDPIQVLWFTSTGGGPDELAVTFKEFNDIPGDPRCGMQVHHGGGIIVAAEAAGMIGGGFYFNLDSAEKMRDRLDAFINKAKRNADDAAVQARRKELREAREARSPYTGRPPGRK